MGEPRDHAARRRFAEELDRNFSVVASAGSGKTYAITERIVHLAGAPNARETLPKLVVVTFTHRAADEMQQRTRQRILEEHRLPDIQAAFNRAFFGTIHSFCMKLLKSHGHHLGLPFPLDLVAEDDDDLWEAFVQQHHHFGRSLSEETRTALFRLAPARQLMELGRNARSLVAATQEFGPCPKVDTTQIRAAAATGVSARTIADSQSELAEWETRCNAGWEFVRWPIRSCDARNFRETWTTAFAPLRGWVADAARCVAAEVQRDFRNFRVERGLVTYADQVALADDLLQHPDASRRLREENFHVILDEAQDTDPVQFSVLTELTRPLEATGRWLESGAAPPRAGHFCMVGDFQQSIYRDRADLKNYQAIHEALVGTDSGEALEFSVTFRLDQKQLDFVNDVFREILNQENGQVKFVSLQPREDVLPGQVIRVSLGGDCLPAGQKLKEYRKAQIEAKALADWIKRTGLKNLRAETWRDVAILCPRKAWLRTMANALRRLDIPVSMQSESDLKGDNPAYAWLTALCTVMVEPRNSYEIVGVLREVFGIADRDLAIFSEGDGRRFQLDTQQSATGVVSSPLCLLAETRREMEGRALFQAVQFLVEQTQLRGKLASLPQEDFDDLEGDLDHLLAFAAEAEAGGTTVADFAEKLRLDFLLPREVRRSHDEGIHLITAQKAKGSEWQAVILPFLARNVPPPSPRYPSIIKVPGSSDVLVALTKDDFKSEDRDANRLAARQEMARLLYVATTRARHTLVLALDEEIFARTKGGMQNDAQLKFLLGEKEINRPYFDALGLEPKNCPDTTKARKQATGAAHTHAEPLSRIDRKGLKLAQERAAAFIRKLNPSGYEEEIIRTPAGEINRRPSWFSISQSAADTPATLYGRWWHDLMQGISWRDKASWKQTFEKHHVRSPVPKRSADEWNLFLQCLENEPDVSELLARAELVAHPEMQFLWRMSERACLEGVIDLALIDRATGKGLILDWKTNRVAPNELDDLRKRYRPQLASYWKAVGAMTDLAIDAALYSTATGVLVRYQPDELFVEWEGLRGPTA